MNGLIHIYCGDGKGKTTAATGLALRAAGSGMKVLFARFLKNESSGELQILDRIPEIEVMHLPKSFGFYRTLSAGEKAEMKQMYEELWIQIEAKSATGLYQMLVIDELMAAYQYHLVDKERVVRFLKEKPEALEVVLTGRNPSDEIIALADYISEIKKIRHPYDQGILARKGIEF